MIRSAWLIAGLGLAGLAGSGAWAAGGSHDALAPVQLEPGMSAVPAVPQPVIQYPQQAAPSQALPAPDLPQATLAPPLEPSSSSAGGGISSPAKRNGATGPEMIKPIWDSRTMAVVDVLDKEDGAVARIKVPVGTAVAQGKLSVEVGACVVRPATMAPDAAVYLTVRTRPPTSGTASPGTPHASSTTPATLFRGWLIRSEPGATVLGDAAVTFRLIGCSGTG